jgi:hypothetical protein
MAPFFATPLGEHHVTAVHDPPQSPSLQPTPLATPVRVGVGIATANNHSNRAVITSDGA